ncbi:MAG TPA: alanine dehydrogenase [Thiolapillus brandeum]|uniref:alanine dehydrogenase n=1 Tax=Thiolapillus brandeum TaxID=1076588 RepID=A0A831WEF6_9GAMM|nr:alanine dehydrogenase [Thiolapillus brandeum]
MRIGIPKEIKPLEGRVALVPQAAADLVHAGHQVSIQSGAGEASGFSDEDYAGAGIQVLPGAADVYGQAQLILKVKEPVGKELELLRPDHLLFSFLHLAALPGLTQKLCEIGLTAIAFETVEEQHRLPILSPMSNIAGRIAIQAGTHYLHRPSGGKGLMLGGLPGTQRGKVVIIGAGNAGGNATHLAAGMGAEVVVFDRQPGKLDAMMAMGSNITALYPYRDALDEQVSRADLLIGAVLIPGAKAPKIVSREQVCSMQPGSVIVDIAVDQGGCIETTRPTTYDDPVYRECGVSHFCVTNIPGAVPRTASLALSASLLPYCQRLAGDDWREDDVLKAAINVENGAVVHPALR